jgi:hypothetical protein
MQQSGTDHDKKRNGKKTPNKGMHWKTSRAVFQITYIGYQNSALRINLVGKIAWVS